LQVCLHYNEPWEEFLVKAVKPYVDVVIQTGVAERYFFLRSWERGPHIRLFFKGNPFILESMLKPNLEEHFLHYFESRPSLLVEPKYPHGFPENFQWFPNNSVQYFDYEPALEMQGGELELTLSEKQFQSSSQIVLDTIDKKATRWTYNEMISLAIKLHLSLAYSIGLSIEEAATFFGLLSQNWIEKHGQSGQKKGVNGKNSVQNSFEKIFQIQRKDLVPYQSAMWELFKNYRKSAEPEFVEWFHLNTQLSLEFDWALDSKKLSPRMNQFPDYSFVDELQKQRWNYGAELIQQTNNRMGIFNKNEGYLFYILAQSLFILTVPYDKEKHGPFGVKQVK